MGASDFDLLDGDVYDALETEADALEEENEAKRLQKKKLADMDEADFERVAEMSHWIALAGIQQENEQGQAQQ